ncbi:hypothetical protein C0995_010225 [Termitomyces sp. Mi166|nr:hypothetical protein C0995_010225 [Termitomyces sp. Mi166\
MPITIPNIRNILVFGEAGVGKSSVINMLAGSPYDTAKISDDATNRPLDNVGYRITIKSTSSSLPVVAWEVTGVNEEEHGTVSPGRKMNNLRRLRNNLGDGPSLLVYIVQGSWELDTRALKTNYDLFVKHICKGNVPVILVVTGCENESPMNNWWIRNERILNAHGLRYQGHVCITSTRGKIKDGEHVFEEEYKESEKGVRRLVADNVREKPWVTDERRVVEESLGQKEH